MRTEAKTRARGPLAMVAMLAVAIAAVFLFWTFARGVSDGLAWHRASELRIIAPDFEAASVDSARKVPQFTLKDRFGNPVSLAQFSGVDLLIVNIWSSGCQVCRDEVPELTEMDRRLASMGKAALITIAIDRKWEDVSSYFPAGTDLRVLFDPENEVGAGIFGTKKYPETFVLDKERRIRARFDGERPWHSDLMLAYLSRFI